MLFSGLNTLCTLLHTLVQIEIISFIKQKKVKIGQIGQSLAVFVSFVRSVHEQDNIFEKNVIEAGSSHLYASFWYLLRPNWLTIRGAVKL